jgi:hypothetical protein
MNTQTQAIENPKKTYTSPRLITYGDVRSLTQAGSTGGSEGGSMSTMVKASDRLTKDNIVRIGVHPLGFGLYLFDYKPEHREKWGHGRQFGVMAQEVEAVMPEAVLVHPDGYKMVNYAMLGISHRIQ